ncbi:MAG TPA: hypothetical protein VK995_02535 [Oceanipulchritudo sp.]|nr:hypothetical protein [Oceanipulchritudo sp.]
MIRGFVYSFVAISVCLLASIIWFAMTQQGEEDVRIGIGFLLACFFLVGPLFFGIGYWHHFRLYPKEPHWDPELGE